jgi:hypothetical protein
MNAEPAGTCAVVAALSAVDQRCRRTAPALPNLTSPQGQSVA